MVELLSPAGSYETLCAAVNAGADAVYIGGSMFGARAYADNPDEELLIRGIEYCHLHGRKIYLTVNTLLKEKELETMLYSYLLPFYENGLDGVIVQDLGVVQFIQTFFPGLPVHASTQMTVTGSEGARFLQQQGITRVVPARELSLQEVRRIIDDTGIEVETFIHGAMCYSYSGQCLFSSMIGGRSGNRGRCAQPCRLPYTCTSGKKTYTGYLLSMKDMCTIDLIPDLIDAGIASMKIEGRMKRSEYAAGVVSIYRKYIDLYQKHGRSGYRVLDEDRGILMDLYNRGGFSQGYYRQHNGPAMMSMNRPNHYGTEAARVKAVRKGMIQAAALEPLHQKDMLELPDGTEITLGKDIGTGAVFDLNCRSSKTVPGDIILRTKNEFLLSQLQEKYLKEKLQVKIKGDLRIFRDGTAILKLNSRAASVTYSEAIAETAQNNPATEDSIRKQMSRTGNTPFVFERLFISLDDGLFIPVRRLNEFRRAALEQLEQAILDAEGRRREAVLTGDMQKYPETEIQKVRMQNPEQDAVQIQSPNYGSAADAPVQACRRLNILVTAWPQLDAVLEADLPELTIIYLDSILFGTGVNSDETFTRAERYIDKIAEKGIRCFLSMPPVFREKERKIFGQEDMCRLMSRLDGFLLHTVDEFAWIKCFLSEIQRDAVLAADDNFYMYNSRASVFWQKQGITQITLPSELNSRELRSLNTSESELNVYGYQALMHSAQCVTANTSGCTHRPSLQWLKDRRNARFPVLNRCPVCCNTIYNSVPLQLYGCRDEIDRLSPAALRMTFTIETYEQTAELLHDYYDIFFASAPVPNRQSEGTRGHFKRGVE